MNGAALAVGIPAGDVLIWISLARVMFRRWHLHEVIKSECPNRVSRNHAETCASCRTDLLWWQDGEQDADEYYLDSDLAFFALLQAFFWWFWIWFYLAGKVVMVGKPETEKQKQDRLSQMESYALGDVDEER